VIRAILTPEQSAAIRWSDGAFTAYMWRQTSRASAQFSSVPLINVAGTVVRILTRWASG
jgi:hypothetical protein